MRVAIRYAANIEDAEQWVHDSFLKIFEQLSNFNFEGSFEGWLKKITARVCLDHIRKNKAIKFSVEQNAIPTDWQNTTSDIYVDNEVLIKWQTEELMEQLNKLPEKQKLIFNLHIFEGYTIKEIAQIMEIQENYVYWILHKARKQLQNILQSKSKKEVNNE